MLKKIAFEKVRIVLILTYFSCVFQRYVQLFLTLFLICFLITILIICNFDVRPRMAKEFRDGHFIFFNCQKIYFFLPQIRAMQQLAQFNPLSYLFVFHHFQQKEGGRERGVEGFLVMPCHLFVNRFFSLRRGLGGGRRVFWVR